MNSSRIFFKMSDLIFHYPRNYKKYQGIVRENDLIYDDRFGRFTMGDIYYNPQKKRGKYPVFINVHGGGFVRGDKRHRSTFCSFIADNGWLVFNINHRLAPRHPFPAGIEDTLNAMNYLLTVADKYDLDTERIVISGDSAGAYYAAAAVASTCDEAFRVNLDLPVYNGKILALATFCGLFDVIKAMCRPTPFDVSKNVAECLLNMKISADYGNVASHPFAGSLNVLDFVNKDWPLTYIVMAEKDSFCTGQGELMQSRLENAGVKVISYNAREYNEGHCFHLLPSLKGTKVCWQHVSAFLDSLRA